MRPLLKIGLVITLMMTNQTNAKPYTLEECKADVNTIINSCSKALVDQDNQITALNKALADSRKETHSCIESKKDCPESPSFWTPLAIGLAAGLVGGMLLAK
jgi:hypothetical protein